MSQHREQQSTWPSSEKITTGFSEDALRLVSQADGAQVLVVDGCGRGVGGVAAAGGDDDSWRDVEAGWGGGGGAGGLCACDVSRLMMAVVGVGGVVGAVWVVVEGAVAGGAVEVAGRPPLIWAAGH